MGVLSEEMVSVKDSMAKHCKCLDNPGGCLCASSTEPARSYGLKDIPDSGCCGRCSEYSTTDVLHINGN